MIQKVNYENVSRLEMPVKLPYNVDEFKRKVFSGQVQTEGSTLVLK